MPPGYRRSAQLLLRLTDGCVAFCEEYTRLPGPNGADSHSEDGVLLLLPNGTPVVRLNETQFEIRHGSLREVAVLEKRVDF